MSERTAAERPVIVRGHPFIRAKSGRHLTFWDCLDAAERAHTDMVRGVSRAFKLALALTDGDIREDSLERLEWFIEGLEDYTAALRKHLEEQRGVHGKKDRIALLRNVKGRTPEEAAEFLRKADELEAKL